MASKWQKFNNNQLVVDTLNEVIAKRKDVQGLIIHSEQGFQYTSLQEYIILVEDWILFYNTTRLKLKNVRILFLTLFFYYELFGVHFT